MAAPSFLIDYARRAEPRLREFLEMKRRAFERVPVGLLDAFSLLTEYILRGGKRLRGALVLLGHQAGGGDGESAFDASIGVELLHAYLLIHDDFMDRDTERRGGRTLHVALGGDHLAGSLAILLGSLCQAWAYELIGERGARIVTRTLEEVTLGQMADLRAPRQAALDAAGVLEVQRLKTGSYTFELPLLLGAILADAHSHVFDALSAYARPLGQAFQIADDLLGTFGSPDETGKSDAGDLREGKRTLLIARALEMASPADAAALRAGLGDAAADVARLRDIIRRSGAADSARDEAIRLRDEALRALSVPALAAVSEVLSEIAFYTVARST